MSKGKSYQLVMHDWKGKYLIFIWSSYNRTKKTEFKKHCLRDRIGHYTHCLMNLNFFCNVHYFFPHYHSVFFSEWVSTLNFFQCKAIKRYSQPITAKSKLASRNLSWCVFPRRFGSIVCRMVFALWLADFLVVPAVWLTADSQWIPIEDKVHV